MSHHLVTEKGFVRRNRALLLISTGVIALTGLMIYLISASTEEPVAPTIQVVAGGMEEMRSDVGSTYPAIEIDPASCLVLNMPEKVTARKDGDVCTVTIMKGENIYLMGFGGWCKALDTTTPAPQGAWVIKIKVLPDTPPAGFKQNFLFSPLDAKAMGVTEIGYDMGMVGLLESEGSNTPHYDSCLDQSESHD